VLCLQIAVSDSGYWYRYLLDKFGPDGEADVAVVRSMMELSALLICFRDSNLRFSMYFRDRVWFPKYLREPERLVQTRALETS
jgi:hypothetical protein